jgi:sugar lactone lactonase YvrE
VTATLVTGLAEVAVPRAELGEGPCWDAAAGALWWTDIPANRVHRLAAGGGHTSWDAGTPVGSLAPRAAGGLVFAAGDGFCAFDPRTGSVTPLAAAEPDMTGLRMNDGACDRAGRFFAGSTSEDESPGHGSFYSLATDHRVTRLFDGVGISNGVGWSPDERLLYYVDSLAYRLEVFDYEPATGAVSGRRGLAGIGGGDVMPDGLTVDSEGGIWVAVWGGGELRRYAPDGRLTGTVELPAANVTCCTFGGPDLRTLYITTAGGPGESAGALFAGQAMVAGQPTSPFRG